MTDLTIDGETFRVEVEGDPARPAVLLSCSLGTDLSLFDAQMAALLEHFRVVRYDPRGHGRSTLSGAPYSLARLGADALGILDALDIEQAHVVGVSMGGAVAQWLLVNAPERIGRAVLANTCARIGTPEVWNARIATVLAEGMGALAQATMERWFGADFRAAAPDRVATIESRFRATSAEGYAGCCAALRDADLRAAIRAVDRPVLILSGRDDPVTSDADIAVMTDAIVGARHVVLDARHISNIEAEAAFNAAVIDFLTAKVPAARPRAARKAATPTRRRARLSTARKPLSRATGSARTAPGARAAKAPARKTKAPARKTKLAPARRATPAAPKAKSATTKPATTKPATPKPANKPAKASPETRAAPKKTAPKRAGLARADAAKKISGRTPVAKKTAAKKPGVKKAAVEKVVKKATVKAPTARRRPTKTPTRPGRRRT